MSSNLVVGLDIGSTKTCAVIAEVGGDAKRPVLKILGVGQTRTGGMRREVVTNIEETTESVRNAMKEAELMAGVATDRVYVGIGGDHVQAEISTGVVAIAGEEIGPADLSRVHEVARAVVVPSERELLHVLPQEYIVDHRAGIRDPIGMAGTRLEAEVYIITTSATASQNLRKAVNRAGYKVEAFVHAPLAAALAVVTEDERDVGVALVDLGGSKTEVAIFRDGKMAHLASVGWGGAAVTSDLAKGLSVPFAEAERAKEKWGVASAESVDPREVVELPAPGPGAKRSVQRELIAHIVEQRLDEILGLVRAQLDEAGEAKDLGAGVVLTGGGASLPGTVEVAQHVFGMPVRVGVPGSGLTGLADSVHKSKFATASGLAVYGAQLAIQAGLPESGRGQGAMGKLVAWLKEFF